MKTSVTPALRRLPPVLIVALVAMWLLLNQTLAPGHVLLGLALAIGLAWASAVLRPAQPSLSRVYLAIVLLFLVLTDIVRSNIAVARIVLGLVRNREIRSGFVKIPLALTDPHGLAVLAGILTATPGTVWVDLDVPTGVLTVHVLDLKDESEWIDWIRNRYEHLLMRIFQ
jgi:multicomponent K+:H+ antiporter subunit E